MSDEDRELAKEMLQVISSAIFEGLKLYGLEEVHDEDHELVKDLAERALGDLLRLAARLDTAEV